MFLCRAFQVQESNVIFDERTEIVSVHVPTVVDEAFPLYMILVAEAPAQEHLVFEVALSGQAVQPSRFFLRQGKLSTPFYVVVCDFAGLEIINTGHIYINLRSYCERRNDLVPLATLRLSVVQRNDKSGFEKWG